jgi:hypothetical protein
MNEAAATHRIAFMFMRWANASPTHTAGALAINMPNVVPVTTAMSVS